MVLVNELGWLLLAFASTVVAANVAFVVLLRAVYKRIRRTLTLNSSVLRARAQLSRGSRREVLRLRVRLRDALESGQAAIDLSVRSDGHRGELPRLFRELTREGAALETQLRLLESENDVRALARMLPAARHRVDEVTSLVGRLRSAVASGLGDFSTDNLTTLRSDVDREVTAVRAGMQELRELNGEPVFREPGRQPSANRATRSELGSQQ